MNQRPHAKIADLGPEDRERIANLLKTLAKTAEEKESVSKQLETERNLFEQQKNEMISQMKRLIKEKKVIKRSMEDCQKLIAELNHLLEMQKYQPHGALTSQNLRSSPQKNLCTASVQTVEQLPEDNNSIENHVRKVAHADSVPFFNFPTRSDSIFRHDRAAVESQIRRQEQLLKEKQKLLLLKQEEFQSRFDYFAQYGKFPESMDKVSPAKPSKDFTAPLNRPKVALVSSSTSPVKQLINSPLKTPMKKINSPPQKNQKKSTPSAPLTSTAKRSIAKNQKASANVNLSNLTNDECLMRERSVDRSSYQEDRELSDIASISALLATATRPDNETSRKSFIESKTTVLNASSASRLSKTFNQSDDTDILEEIFFLS